MTNPPTLHASQGDLLPGSISLDGDWEFTYTPGDDREENSTAAPALPEDDEFPASMRVPGYWDDHLDLLREAPFWSQTVRFNSEYRPPEYPLGDRPPDATTPFLLGIGWYRKRIRAPETWRDRCISLHIGGVKLEAWAWLNHKLIGHHLGHSTSFKIDLGAALRRGESNHLLIAVANTRTDRLGTVIRGWKGFSGGIYGPVCLKVAGPTALASGYVHALDGLDRLRWRVDLAGRRTDEAEIRWRVVDGETGELASGRKRVAGPTVMWETATFNMVPWSDNTPKLYEIQLELKRGKTLLDTLQQPFGLRRLERDGMNLRLNGRPVFLRGGCEHAYYPETCTPPPDRGYYRQSIAELKAIGFNWMRFHTSVPSEPYLQAADELGMMIQVEPPSGFTEKEWVDILMACRKHPSVVIYCCGNEETLDEEKIEYLSLMARRLREFVPDGLFNPQEALRGVEYGTEEQFGDGLVEEPYPHNPSRLEKLKEFSDCFGQFPWGYLSYHCSRPDVRLIDERLEVYERPCLSHEMGILPSYLNLDLEHRYEGTRIGPDMFRSLRRNLKAAGLIDRAALYYRNSCAWARTIRKNAIEAARRCRRISGYDFLAPSDCHWHRTGYAAGILNEFGELKAGDSRADVLKYHGESVLLCDHGEQRNVVLGGTIKVALLASLFGPGPVKQSRLSWCLRETTGAVHDRGEITVAEMIAGGPAPVAEIEAGIRNGTKPLSLTLEARLSGAEYEIVNDWRFWAFPAGDDPDLPSGSGEHLRVVRALDEAVLKGLVAGGRVLLLGHEPFPALPVSFQPACAGRALGNMATAVADHPLMRGFPHDGYCDWQFLHLMEHGAAVVFDDLATPFEPIVEMVSSYKVIRKQAALFECNVGKGRLLVCSFNLDKKDDPATAYLVRRLLGYAAGDAFRPANDMPSDDIARFLGKASTVVREFTTDMAADPMAERRR